MNNKKVRLKFIYVYLFSWVFFSVSGFAKDYFNTESGNFFNLSLHSEVGQTDNFLFTNQHEQQTSFITLSPSIALQTQFDNQLFNLEFESEHIKFQDFSKDDHTNYTLAPRYQFKIAANKAFFIKTTIANIYENRGTGLTLGKANLLTKGDKRESSDFSVGYMYGSQTSVAKLTAELGQFTHQYNTRRDQTYLLDQQKRYANISFDYLLSGQSYLATNIAFENITFEHNNVLNKKKYTALAGMKWQTTEISQLALLLGYQQIKFAQTAFHDDDGFKWRFDWQWHPIYSTKVVISTERDFQEANRLSNSYRIVDNFDIKLTSRLSDLFNATAIVGTKREKIIYQQGKEKEHFLYSQFTVQYQRNEWLSFYLKYQYQDLDASEIMLDYQRNSISIGFDVTL
ncbi:outer membrane beta-barrel protein [Thalassotalea sp. SU-HH00458]|uniref:outer membrane beta-barrel protein n=1 Tax=Thalassotalea sp. SU-HH00458 TaxID=3127657 RepID=UPI003102FFA9